MLTKRSAIESLKAGEAVPDSLTCCRNRSLAVTMGGAKRFRNNFIDHTESQQVLRCQFQRICRIGRMTAVTPQNRRTAFRRDDRIHGMFEHQDAVRRGDRNGHARTAFADHKADDRYSQFETDFDGSGNCLSLAALFRPDAGISASSIDKCDYRQAEAVRQMHQALCLAIPFGPGHAEIMLHAGFGIVAFFLPDNDDGLAFEPAEAADNGVVFRITAITGKGGKLVINPLT